MNPFALTGQAVNDADHSPRGSLRTRTLVAIFVLFFALQLGMYREVLYVQPSGDDYILPLQIKVGEQEGPWEFFASSPVADYRPLQSMVYWAVGRWSIESPFGLVRVLNFVSFTFYALVFAVWLRQTRLPLNGVLAAIALLVMHPILVGPLAGLDGFTRFVVSCGFQKF